LKKLNSTGGDQSTDLWGSSLVLCHCPASIVGYGAIIKIHIKIFDQFSEAPQSSASIKVKRKFSNSK
jgi:hypothetical protein